MDFADRLRFMCGQIQWGGSGLRYFSIMACIVEMIRGRCGSFKPTQKIIVGLEGPDGFQATVLVGDLIVYLRQSLRDPTTGAPFLNPGDVLADLPATLQNMRQLSSEIQASTAMDMALQAAWLSVLRHLVDYNEAINTSIIGRCPDTSLTGVNLATDSLEGLLLHCRRLPLYIPASSTTSHMK
jgi:hypothetical protein